MTIIHSSNSDVFKKDKMKEQIIKIKENQNAFAQTCIAIIEQELFRKCGMCKDMYRAASKRKFGFVDSTVLYHHAGHFNEAITTLVRRPLRVNICGDTPLCYFNPCGLTYKVFPVAVEDQGTSVTLTLT